MISNVTVSLRVRNVSLIQSVQEVIDLAKARKVDPMNLANTPKDLAIRLFPSTAGLLQDFKESFWHSLSCFDRIEDYHPETDGSVLKELIFQKIDFRNAREFAPQLATWMQILGFNDVREGVEDLFSHQTSTNLFKVGGAYKARTLAIFLGAGISKDIGLPLWPDLLSRMADDLAAKSISEVLPMDRLRTRSLPEQARWLRNKLKEDFYQAVRQALYRDVYQHGIVPSPVLSAIARMKSLRAVCTYNYDDFLEQQDDALFKSIASARHGYSGDQIPVYHVHGFLPYIGDPCGDVILSEFDYHRLANNHLHWANAVQVNLLRECTCLFIGISGTDPNLRRLLDLVGEEKTGETYIILKADEAVDPDSETLKQTSMNKEFDRDHFRDINLLTIWIHDYSEIPGILELYV